MCEPIKSNKGVWYIWIDLNTIQGIGLNPFTYRVNSDYTQIGSEPKSLTWQKEDQGSLSIRLEIIIFPQWASAIIPYERKKLNLTLCQFLGFYHLLASNLVVTN